MGGSSTGGWDIYVVTLVSGYPTVNVTNHPAMDMHFSWSPSGDQLAFVSNRSGSAELWVIDSNGANATQLTSDGGSKHSTAWSPNGRWIAYVRNDDIWVYDRKFASSKNLTMGNGENIEPCWSPSGTQIVFVSDRSGNRDIWVMDASGANLTQLTNTPQEERRPVWSPNGQKIAFERGTIGWSNIWVMDANGANQLNLTNSFLGARRHISWSPDSQSVVYMLYNHLYRINVDGTGDFQLTSTGSNRRPSWCKSSTGQHFIAFERTEAGSNATGIYYMSPNGGGILGKISGNIGSCMFPEWAP